MSPWMELPYEITNVTPEEDKLIRKCLFGQFCAVFSVLVFACCVFDVSGYTTPFVKCGKEGYVMPGAFRKHAEYIYNMQVRPDDVWVITFPRSGTTWTQEMIWLLENDLDYHTAKEIPLYKRFPMLETTSQIPSIAFDLVKANFMNLGNFQGVGDAVRVPSFEAVDKAPSPRLIKTHLPLSLLPPNLLKIAKVVYVARDPRDIAVSYFYLHKMIAKSLIRASFVHFWETFRRDLMPYCPVVKHTNEAWLQRDNPNLHFIYYEDMIKDLPNEIRRMTKFLKRDYSDGDIQQLAKHLNFDNLKKNKTVNNTVNKEENTIQFVRKGESGGWKTHFDEKMQVQAEEFLIERLNGLDLSYPLFTLTEMTRL